MFLSLSSFLSLKSTDTLLKRKEILTDATTWMKLEDILLSETSQPQKEKYGKVPLRPST